MRKQTHPTQWDWGQRRGAPWTDDDVVCALFMRHCGLKDPAIAEVLHRSEKSIRAKIGYVPNRKMPPRRAA
jgi:hypothetical protein